MTLNKVLAFVVLVLAVGGGYWLGKNEPGNLEPVDAEVSGAPALAAQGSDKEVPEVSHGSGTFSHFRVGNRNVKTMFAEEEIIWVGTSGGVLRYDIKSDQYQRFDTSTGLLANGVFYVGRIQGRLAVGTYGGGLSLMKGDGNGWDTYNVPEGLADAFVYDVLEDPSGDIWIATWSGLNRVRGGELDNPAMWETYTVANTGGGLPNDWVYALDTDA